MTSPAPTRLRRYDAHKFQTSNVSGQSIPRQRTSEVDAGRTAAAQRCHRLRMRLARELCLPSKRWWTGEPCRIELLVECPLPTPSGGIFALSLRVRFMWLACIESPIPPESKNSSSLDQ